MTNKDSQNLSDKQKDNVPSTDRWDELYREKFRDRFDVPSDVPDEDLSAWFEENAPDSDDEDREAWEKVCEMDDLLEKIKEYESKTPKTITEIDIRDKRIEEIERRLKPLRDYFDIDTSKKSIPEKKLRLNQRHKKECRKVAGEIWVKNPDRTIADIANNSNRVVKACENKIYAEETIRNWIKDLCPNRKPGRRPKKT